MLNPSLQPLNISILKWYVQEKSSKWTRRNVQMFLIYIKRVEHSDARPIWLSPFISLLRSHSDKLLTSSVYNYLIPVKPCAFPRWLAEASRWMFRLKGHEEEPRQSGCPRLCRDTAGGLGGLLRASDPRSAGRSTSPFDTRNVARYEFLPSFNGLCAKPFVYCFNKGAALT